MDIIIVAPQGKGKTDMAGRIAQRITAGRRDLFEPRVPNRKTFEVREFAYEIVQARCSVVLIDEWPADLTINARRAVQMARENLNRDIVGIYTYNSEGAVLAHTDGRLGLEIGPAWAIGEVEAFDKIDTEQLKASLSACDAERKPYVADKSRSPVAMETVSGARSRTKDILLELVRSLRAMGLGGKVDAVYKDIEPSAESIDDIPPRYYSTVHDALVYLQLRQLVKAEIARLTKKGIASKAREILAHYGAKDANALADTDLSTVLVTLQGARG